MPELPEVETIKRRLAEQIVGKQISQIEVFRTKSFQGDPDQIMGQTITAVHRYAKMICFHLAERPALLIHLKMTGQLIYKDGDLKVGGGHPTSDWIGSLPANTRGRKLILLIRPRCFLTTSEYLVGSKSLIKKHWPMNYAITDQM